MSSEERYERPFYPRSYVEWSSHEPEEGEFDFDGEQNLVGFLQLAHSLGFMVILRPGPYICAERDFVSPFSLMKEVLLLKI